MNPEQQPEQVDHPPHYQAPGDTAGTYEVIRILAAYGLAEAFCAGNVIKYTLRAGKKGDKLMDLEKAAWYANWLVENEKRKRQEGAS